MTAPIMGFDRAKLERLREEHEKCVRTGRTMFEFEGSVLLCSFAKYLIEYLDNVLKED